MKKPSIKVRPVFLFQVLLLQLSLSAQVQWYQNQDGCNQAPNGTFAAAVQPYNTTSFIACYQWQVINDVFTWKISRTATNGTELRTFFVEGTYATAEIKVIQNGAVYVLKKDYPPGMDPQYTLYKLNADLELVTERSISFPNSFTITNLGAFEIDQAENIYLVGDGQYPDSQGGYGFASFILKADNNLDTQWSRMDSIQTTYTRLMIDGKQRVTVIEDNYINYPSIRIIRVNPTGTSVTTSTVIPDPARYSLFTAFDNNDDLLLYGGKMLNDTTQAVYLCKLSRMNDQVLFRKTQFTAPGSQLNDLKIDEQGRIFSLVTLYYPDKQFSQVSRLKPNNGEVLWSRSFPFETDSCQLGRLIINESEQIYAIGEKRSGSYYARGYATLLQKNGQVRGELPGPDSVNYQRYHSLTDGFIDSENKLIAIGNTNDYDTTIYTSTYYRAFAVRFQQTGSSNKAVNAHEEKKVVTGGNKTTKVQFYPNPVQHQLLITRLDQDVYDELLIYNMQGRMLAQQKVSAPTTRMDVSRLSEGVYMLVFRSSGSLKERTERFIVRR